MMPSALCDMLFFNAKHNQNLTQTFQMLAIRVSMKYIHGHYTVRHHIVKRPVCEVYRAKTFVVFAHPPLRPRVPSTSAACCIACKSTGATICGVGILWTMTNQSLTGLWATVHRDSHSKPLPSVLANSEQFDEAHQQAFVEFKSAKFGKHFLSFSFASVATVISVLFWVMALYDRPEAFPIAIAVLTFTTLMPSLWLVCWVRQNPQRMSRRAVWWAENSVMVIAVITVALLVLMRQTNGRCTNERFLSSWACTPIDGLAVETVLILLIIPLLCSLTLPSITALTVMLSYAIIMAVITIAAVLSHATVSIAWIIIAHVLVLAVHALTSWTQRTVYFYALQAQNLLLIKSKEAARSSEDMRNLIGKIAHDLRTVSASSVDLRPRLT